jgi:hypothetical protein
MFSQMLSRGRSRDPLRSIVLGDENEGAGLGHGAGEEERSRGATAWVDHGAVEPAVARHRRDGARSGRGAGEGAGCDGGARRQGLAPRDDAA